MPVAHNVWHPPGMSPIVPANRVDCDVAERLITSCPAGLFSLTPEGELRVDFRGCLECGTCRLLCDEKNATTVALPTVGFWHHLPLWLNNKDNLCLCYTCSDRIQ